MAVYTKIVPSFCREVNYFKKNTNIKYLETKPFFIDNCQKIKIFAAQKTYSLIIVVNII